MANVKYIVLALVASAVMIVLIALWVAQRGGETDLFGNDRADTFNEALPGPVSLDEQGEDDQVTQEPMSTTTGGNSVAIFHTNKGDITLELYEDVMPITVGNFAKLAKEGFYNGTKFHRVIDGFMIQGGDPNSKGANTAIYGQGGPGYTIQDEFVADPRLTNTRGSIAMANTGQPNSGGSQFFINLVANVGLDYDKEPAASRHPVFGRVSSGMDIVDLIAKVETGANDVPATAVVIESIEIK